MNQKNTLYAAFFNDEKANNTEKAMDIFERELIEAEVESLDAYHIHKYQYNKEALLDFVRFFGNDCISIMAIYSVLCHSHNLDSDKDVVRLSTKIIDLWLKDENNISIGYLSDRVMNLIMNKRFNVDEICEMNERELLNLAYMSDDEML